jgi:uncharacterized membrane protein
MFPSNNELLENTKEVLKDKYLHVFFTWLLIQIVMQGIGSQYIYEEIYDFGLIAGVVYTFFNIFITACLSAGLVSYFIKISRGEGLNFNSIFGFFSSFKALLILILLLFVLIPMFILFVIPGIYFSMKYSQVFFILADNPNVGVFEAFSRSSRLMNGRKMQLFFYSLRMMFFLFLGVFTIFIWWIWLIPKFNVGLANFYNALLESSDTK